MSQRVAVLGDRLYMKFPDMSFFAERLRECDAEIVDTQGMSYDEIMTLMPDISAMVLIGHPIDRAMIEAAVNCRFIMTLSVGFDVVDLDAATERGIPVSNCPLYCSSEVAQHAITLALTTSRKIHELIPHTREAGWDYKQTRPIHSFATRRFGIVGLGRIGRNAARYAQGLGMTVLAYDPYLDDDLFELLGVERRYQLEDLLDDADILSIHCPLTDETWHMIDAAALKRMKPHAVVVNTARGAIIDIPALEEALRNGDIAGAGIDVLEVEPPSGSEPILSLPSAVVTPHIAWYSEESHHQNMVDGMNELVRVLRGERPRYIVNPQIFSRR